MPVNNETDHDVDFVEAMHDLLDMDEKAVEQLLDKLDANQLQDLTDAVAKKDRAAAEKVIGNFNTDEEVNALFRGKNLDVSDKQKKPTPNADGKAQFAFGDDVQVTLKDTNGKAHQVTGTVSQPDGPEGTDTIVVRIKGKSKVVDKRHVTKLDENVLGMVGLPNLNRIQQLAGIQSTAQPQNEPPQLALPAPDAAPDDPSSQAMCALDTLEAVLPNITLADLKAVRQRLNALQTLMNESMGRSMVGRTRKL